MRTGTVLACCLVSALACPPAPKDSDPSDEKEKEVELCGNAQLDEGEACDGDLLGEATCVSQGFDYGDLSCGTDCSFDTSGCVDDPCWDYPCRPYGSDPGNVITDLSFTAANEAAFELSGETRSLKLSHIYQRSVSRGGDLRGMMIFVTAGWCPYCKIEAAWLEDMYQEIKDQGILLVGLVTDDNRGAPADADFARGYAREYGWSLPTTSGSLALDYWPPGENAGAVPSHLFIDLRNMRIFGKFAGLADRKILRKLLQELAAGPTWGPDGERELDFDCAAGIGNENEPNGLSGTPEDGTRLPFSLSGVICPPSVADDLALDEDVIDLGTLQAGTMIDVSMIPGTGSEVYPYFMAVRLDAAEQSLVWQQTSPVDMKSGEIGRQWVIDETGHYLLAALDGRMSASSYYGIENPVPDADACCDGGPTFTYDLQVRLETLQANQEPLTKGENRAERLDVRHLSVYPVAVTSGTSYRVEMHADVPADLDTYLILYDPSNSTVVMYNDDINSSSQNYNSRLSWTASHDGEQWVIASYFVAYVRNTAPGYSLSLE